MDNEITNEAIKSSEDLMQSAIDIKNYCKNRDECRGCIFDDGDICKLTNKAVSFMPEDWEV